MRSVFTAIVTCGLCLLGMANSSVAQQEQPRNAWQTADAYLAAALAGKVEEAAAMGEAGKAPSRPKTIRDVGALKAKRLKVVSAHANDQHALAVTEEVTDDRDRKRLLQLTLVKDEDRWLIRDIDFETPDSAKEELKRFLDKNPGAKPLGAPASKLFVIRGVGEAPTRPLIGNPLCVTPSRLTMT